MVHNYIKGFGNYYDTSLPLGFFTYIACGFGSRIDTQIRGIVEETGVHSSVINVHNMIELVQDYNAHSELVVLRFRDINFQTGKLKVKRYFSAVKGSNKVEPLNKDSLLIIENKPKYLLT